MAEFSRNAARCGVHSLFPAQAPRKVPAPRRRGRGCGRRGVLPVGSAAGQLRPHVGIRHKIPRAVSAQHGHACPVLQGGRAQPAVLFHCRLLHTARLLSAAQHNKNGCPHRRKVGTGYNACAVLRRLLCRHVLLLCAQAQICRR